MALNFVVASLHPKPSSPPPPLLFPKHKHLLKLHQYHSSSSSSFRTFSQSEGTEGGVTEQDPTVSFSGTQLLHSFTTCFFISFFLLDLKSFHSLILLPVLYIDANQLVQNTGKDNWLFWCEPRTPKYRELY
jgi:hypothetical protein